MARALIPSRSVQCPAFRQREFLKHEIHSLRANTLVLEIRVDENSADIVLPDCARQYDETTYYPIIEEDFVVPARSHHSSLPVGRLVSKRAPCFTLVAGSAIVYVILEGTLRRVS